MYPHPPRPASRLWIIALTVVAVLAVVTVVAALRSNSVIAGTALPADEYGPQTTTSAPPTSSPPTSAPTAWRIPALTPGWQTAYAVTRNAVYDVPLEWEVQTSSFVFGFEGKESTLFMRGIAALQPNACGRFKPAAIAGVTGSRIADPAAAASDAAERWTKVAVEDAGMGGWGTTITYGAPESLTVQGRNGFHVMASITNQGAVDCRRAPRSVLHTVAVPDDNGQTVILVIQANQGIAEAPSEETLRQMYTTLRTAGLPKSECKKDFEVIGTWC